MRKINLICFAIPLFLKSTFLVAQLSTSATAGVPLNEEQEKFLFHLDKIAFDSAITKSISRLVKTEIEDIRQFITVKTSLPDSEQVKALKSLIYFLSDMGRNIDEKKTDIYDIPGAFDSYKNLLKALLHHHSLTDILLPLSPRRSRLLANAFRQYEEYTFLDDIAVYKLIALSPEHVVQFLENKPHFRFADSLLMRAVAYDPLKIFPYLLKHVPVNNSNIYMQQILSLSENKLASELMPFIVPLAENKITSDEILEKRMHVNGYFQLLVNTLENELAKRTHPSFLFHSPLRNGIKQKSLSFYVQTINDLHSAPDKIRFSSIKDLRAEDLYYIITSCEDELYTSSYLGLYRRLMEHLKDQADSIFQIVHYDNFRVFMRMAANYNTLADFLNRLPQDRVAELLKRFIAGIEKDAETGLEKAMDIADSYTGISNVISISELIQNELKSNLDRCQTSQSFFGVRLYRILMDVFQLVKEKNPANKLWKQLGNYEVLEQKSIQNKNEEIIEMVMFYGDEDGISSFNNFLSSFKDSATWKISKNHLWATIRSVSGQPLVVYANLPLNTKEELDLQAQDSLSDYLLKESLVPVILIHRGHSYHLDNTLKKMEPAVKLAFLGSCGGYNSIISVANINPDAQIIVTKKTGSKLINDPMIEEINAALVKGKDLIWQDVWEDLKNRFIKDEFLLNLFNEYLPPEKNVSLFVLKLFNSYE